MRNTILLICAILLCACRVTKEEMDINVVISMQKTKCVGNCPAYTLDIYQSGKVYLSGRENVDKIGEYEIKLSKKELQRLVDLFLSNDFFSFEDQYINEDQDLPATHLYFSHNGKRKRITNYGSAPPSLKALEYEVGQLIKIPKWKQMKKNN